jgi:hypothetical protein
MPKNSFWPLAPLLFEAMQCKSSAYTESIRVFRLGVKGNEDEPDKVRNVLYEVW